MAMVILAIGLIFLGAGILGIASELMSDRLVHWFEKVDQKIDSLLGE